MEVFEQIDAFLGWPAGTVALLFAALCGVCAFIASFMSAPGEDAGFLHRFFYTVINKLGQNRGKALNADDAARLASSGKKV